MDEVDDCLVPQRGASTAPVDGCLAPPRGARAQSAAVGPRDQATAGGRAFLDPAEVVHISLPSVQ